MNNKNAGGEQGVAVRLRRAALGLGVALLTAGPATALSDPTAEVAVEAASTQPTESTEPNAPSEPTAPAEPATPSTETAVEAVPTQPAVATEPTTSAEPKAMPVEPAVEAAQPTAPSEPTATTEPTATAAQPAATQTAAPAEAATPTPPAAVEAVPPQPTTPTEPTSRAEPAATAVAETLPAATAVETAPAQPAVTAEPTTSGESTVQPPVEPAADAATSQPAAAAEAATPVEPTTPPVEATVEAVPAQRMAPAKPAALPAVAAAARLIAQVTPPTAPAALPAEVAAARPDQEGVVLVPLYKSSTVRLARSAKRIAVGNPGIADIISLKDNQIYILGKALGNTNVTAWDANENIIASFDIEVTHDLDTIKRKIHEWLPGEKIGVSSAQDRIVLNGEVSSLAKMNAAKELAQSFLPECVPSQTDIEVTDAKTGERSRTGSRTGATGQACKPGSIVNLMQIGGAQQVMLEVKVAEMSRSLTRKFSSDFNIIGFGTKTQGGIVSGGASFPNALTPAGLEVPIYGALDGSVHTIGPMVNKFQPNTPTISSTGAFISHLNGKYAFQAAIEASRDKGLAKILAEPTLTTLTGQEAEFLSGGEFPIPVPQAGGATGAVTIVFKEFGVGVKFLPVVLDSGRINMKMSVSVSELSNAASVALGVSGTASTFTIPSLTRRSSAATVELADGQTIGIAGLLSDNLRENVQKFPGLGDIPVLGNLLRSQDFLSGQTELVIFVTAHLAKPIAPSQVRLPTESFVPPNDLEFYLMGKLEGRKAPTQPARAEPAPAGGTEGAQFGHQP